MWSLKTLAALVIATGISLAGTAWYAYSSGKQSGMSQIQTQWDAERRAQTEAQMQELMKAKQREAELQAKLARQRKEHKNEIDRITAEHNAFIDGLRDRPETRAGDSGVPEGAGVGVGCTGRGLSAPDAQFLAGYAANAARTQAALQACQRAYNEIRETVNARD